MPKGKSSTNLGAIVSTDLKERLKRYADSKHWSMSQATAILLEEALSRAEAEVQEKKSE